MRPLAVLGLVALGACAHSGSPPRAGTPAWIDPSAGALGDDICLVRLDAVVRPGVASCISDDAVADWQGLLRYPCAGGEAEALFGNLRLAGEVQSGRVDVRLETSFQFSDGCTWNSRQRIDGALDSGTLMFRYSESPAPGQKDCEEACEVERPLHVGR